MSISENIKNMLEKAELENNIKIPIAIESGSRGWGFESPNSDYDCRFIYVRKTKEYLSVFKSKDTIEYKPDEVYDISGWDLKKVVQNLVKSNASVHEWLASNIIYRENREIHDILYNIAELYFNPISVSYHYLSIAKNFFYDIKNKNEANIKKYFYILRPLASARYVFEHRKIPYMEYIKNLENINLSDKIKEEILIC